MDARQFLTELKHRGVYSAAAFYSAGARALLAALLACLLLACSNRDSNVAAGNRAGILHYGNGAEPQSLDPHVMTGTPEINIGNALFEGLVTINPNTLEPEPGVAEHWSFSDDRRVITFYLNPAARWSNGDPVTADDFVWSWRRSLSPDLGNVNAALLFPIRNAQAFATGAITDPQALGFRALGPNTLEVSLNEPTPYFIYLLSSFFAYPVHRQTIEKFGAATDRFTQWTRPGNIVTNGPFRLTDWQLNRRIVVEKNPNYWNADTVRLQGVVFHPIDSAVTEERMFRANQLHYTQSVPLGKIALYKSMANSPYVQAPLLGTYYYMFNTTEPPLDDIRVRRAMAMAIDRETLADTVLQNTSLPAYSFIPPGMPGYQPSALIAYDTRTAKELMAEAGHPNGENWPAVEVTFSSAENNRKIAVAMQQMWKDVLNIDVTVTNLEWKVYLDTLVQMNYQLANAGWFADFIDPSAFLSIFVTDGGNNATGFANPRFEDLVYRQAPRAATPELRMTLFHEAEAILIEEMPIIPLFSSTSKHLLQPSVRGLRSNILDRVNLRYVWLESQ